MKTQELKLQTYQRPDLSIKANKQTNKQTNKDFPFEKIKLHCGKRHKDRNMTTCVKLKFFCPGKHL